MVSWQSINWSETERGLGPLKIIFSTMKMLALLPSLCQMLAGFDFTKTTRQQSIFFGPPLFGGGSESSEATEQSWLAGNTNGNARRIIRIRYSTLYCLRAHLHPISQYNLVRFLRFYFFTNFPKVRHSFYVVSLSGHLSYEYNI